ncbi:MAG: endolytic transglycosylase MltG, partial [Candidatus Riflebacteria bacterium]
FGADSMRAVAHPAETDYLYFVSDGRQGHRFSTTLQEHNRNANQFFKERRRKTND